MHLVSPRSTTTPTHSSRLSGIAALGIVVFATGALSGCVPNATTADRSALTVSSTATECSVSSTEAASGLVVFSVTNNGDQVSEFYVLGSDQLRIAGEVENIGPGLSRDLVVNLTPGEYFTACKPGMVGAGIGVAAFTVTDSGQDLTANGDIEELIGTATASYALYTRDQVEQLVTGTDDFAAAYIAGEDDLARSLYAPTRMSWERIETVAESFGDLDPKMDLREADLEEGQAWTGWHAIEKDLWPANAEPGFEAYSAEKRTALAQQLVSDTASLFANVQQLEFTLDQLSNGAIGLLDEVASGKVTGEEEFWSHTDLWDFQANIDGARALFDNVRGILEVKDADLTARLDDEFDSLQSLLDSHRAGDGFVLYTDLTTDDVRALSDAVNALAEPLSGMTAALVL
jgi:iron uptake system component EfeO